MTKKRMVRTIAGQERSRNCRAERAADLAWPRRSIISSSLPPSPQSGQKHALSSGCGPGPPCIVPTRSAGPCRTERVLLDDHILERSGRLVDDEVGGLLGGQAARLHALQGGEDDAVEIAELRVVGQELE